MRFRTIAAATLGLLYVAGTTLTGPALAETAKKPLTAAQEEAIKALVKKYLIEHPEVIVEAMERLRAERQKREKEQVKAALVARRKEIYEDAASPVAGNKAGDVVIVEFFDYQCSYCKSVVDRLMKTIKDDGKIKIVFKEFPILGPQSVFAARAALAARKQGKYFEFHNALMKLRGRVTQVSVFAVAKSVGIDTKQLAEDMRDPAIDKALRANFALARDLRINGTPAFIIGDQLVPGAVNRQMLEGYIEQAR
ncbi:MAG: DsbA family protein, partial [Alphaproteobacteria bacterium]|nr:DsbA family protein [Alphaproteobacteria bacterium]